MAFSTEEILALHALRDGVLRLEHGAWWIVADDHAREVSARLVQGLRGQGLLAGVLDAKTDQHEFHLTERGRRVAENAFAGLAARGAADERAARALLRHGPLALLRPAADSEEVDYLLAIRVDGIEAQQHRARMMRARAAAAADPDAFAFVQYRSEVAALPISPALASRGLVPREGRPFLVLAGGLSPEDTDMLGARGCPDRGVDYGPEAVRWFGGFGEADPLITTPPIPHAAVERMLLEAERPAADTA